MFITVKSKVNECTFRQILHYSGKKKHLCWNFGWSSFPLTPSSLSCKWRLLTPGEHIFIIRTQSDCSFYQRITLKLFQLCRRKPLFYINCKYDRFLMLWHSSSKAREISMFMCTWSGKVMMESMINSLI